MRDAQTASTVFTVLGGALAVVALGMMLRQVRRLAGWTGVSAVVIGHRVRQTFRKGRRRTFHHPLVRYSASGVEHVYESPLSSSQPRRVVGTVVRLRHDPERPEAACIDEVLERHFPAFVIGAIGVIFFATGVWLR